MSVQFGRWNFDGKCVDAEYMRDAQGILAPYAPDSLTVCTKGPFSILHRAFVVTPEAHRQPGTVVSPAGAYFTWTGRLDNRSEIASQLPECSSPGLEDSEIVSSFYERRGRDCLIELVGDWSLSVMHPYDRRLLLAVDFLGVSPLYYLRTEKYVAWSSVLEALAVLNDRKSVLSEDYAAGWLYGFPAAELTPYREIRAVPPGSSVEFNQNDSRVRQFWRFRQLEPLCFSRDAEFEEGFRYFFRQSVRRRLRSSRPVLSELSGGMDSSAIVCVADQVLKDDASLTPHIETLSYLNDTEPSWNERPFVEAVERLRGKIGYHIDVSGQLALIPQRDQHFFPSTPALGVLPSIPQRQVSNYLAERDIRVVLSGLGGDETTGGVPDGSAELADLLVKGQVATFLKQAISWCLPTRRPLIHLVGSVLGGFLPKKFFRANLLRKRVPWISKKLERDALDNPACARLNLKFRGIRPSVQENLYTLDNLRRQIARAAIPSSPPCERRYPFLDRDLLEFLYNTPREQIVRPGRRRSLMRRALSGIVPEMILERKRKAHVGRNAIMSFQALANDLQAWTRNLHCAELGLVDPISLRQALVAACRGEDTYLWPLSNTLVLESWLRDERVQKLLIAPQFPPLQPKRCNDNANGSPFVVESSHRS